MHAIDEVDTTVQTCERRLAEQLKQDRPWRDIAGVSAEVDAIRSAYAKVRAHLLRQQDELADAARAQVKGQDGFAGLSADERHRMLQPIQEAVVESTEEAIAPPLVPLRDGMHERLRRGEEVAIENLDALRAQKQDSLVVKVSLSLHNREIHNQADVDALLDEIRQRLLEQLNKNENVRIRLS